jgi:hypothetical protein
MIPKEDSWTIVIAGNWNRMIFSPNWVGKKIFKTKEVEVRVPLQITNPIVYKYEDITLSINETRVTIGMLALTDDSIKHGENIACMILQQLYHTPVSGIGVNFVFKEANPTKALNEVLSHTDDSHIANDWDIKRQELFRRLIKGSRILNMSIMSDDSGVEISANFHSDVKTANEAEEAIKDKTLEMKSEFVNLIEQVYKLKLESSNNAREK